METLILATIFPIAWPIFSKIVWRRDIEMSMFLVHLLLFTVSCIGLYFYGVHSKTTDVEIWNGQVTSKTSDHVFCSHSYSCNCKTNSKGTTSCDTCYEHSYDIDWNVQSSAGNFTIDRIDRRGTKEPPRWTVVQAGQPVSQKYDFENLIKGAQDSLFHEHEYHPEKYPGMLPDYPSNVYDYQFVDRVISVGGVSVPNMSEWNTKLALMLRDLGPAKQANVIMVFANTSDTMYADALRRHWLGGKKNDVIIVFGTPKFPEIEWVRVISWTDKNIFKVTLRDNLMGIGTLKNPDTITQTIHTDIMRLFVRKKMKDFEVLKYEIVPSGTIMTVVWILATFGTLLFTWVAMNFHLGMRGNNIEFYYKGRGPVRSRYF